jgi:hypothetical protein
MRSRLRQSKTRTMGESATEPKIAPRLFPTVAPEYLLVTKRLVAEVKSLSADGRNARSVAAALRISKSTVYKIKRGGFDDIVLPD